MYNKTFNIHNHLVAGTWTDFYLMFLFPIDYRIKLKLQTNSRKNLSSPCENHGTSIPCEIHGKVKYSL